MSSRPLLDPKVLTAIKDLSLVARTVIDGFMAGLNRSQVKGTGLEFSQYRSYQPGDDLRWLDWKMYARSDRYYIRESEMETSISVRFLIDASNSMNHQDSGLSKMDYARYLAAALAYLSFMQGDATGLYVFQDGQLFSLPSRKDPQHLSRIFYQLENIQPAGQFTNEVHYKQLFTGERRKELLIFITDMYQQRQEITTLLNSLAALQHEIIVFHLMGRNELEMNFSGYTTLQDLETGETTPLNNAQMKKAYTAKLQAYLAATRMQLLEQNIFYRLVEMDQPLDKALRDFLNQRQKSLI
ncbi:DUF58 domain-containing protein [Chitinophaga agrisoli]|uniref:DUF58 domain-containing protein n=1 Tax=Chitinophaga agrisoli TaxID=2607653 RepID=A0A5B2VZR3_9BACT|nr:DUF58 domain-containing protein [Chitinophaga agrisoli]KAA2244901.1 DUF58 domain-containing protein [Chitinophaga agrisoli]